MIWYWIALSFQFIARLILPVRPRDIARIDPNSPCPICGARSGKLRAVELGNPELQRSFATSCEHTCDMCGAQWYEDPVVKVGPDRIRPSIARTPLEEKMDAAVWKSQYGRIRPQVQTVNKDSVKTQ